MSLLSVQWFYWTLRWKCVLQSSLLLKFEIEEAILFLRRQPGCSVLPVRWMSLGFVVRAKYWREQRNKKTKNKTKTLSHKIRAHTAATQTCTRMHAQTTRHMLINWRASQTRTSAELINNNLDKLSLSDHSARPNNRTTDETIAAGPETWATALRTSEEKKKKKKKAVAGPQPSCLRRGHCDSWPKGNLDRVVQ